MRFLAERGVNGIKVGIGPGGGCTTRLTTSFGVPQLQALVECRMAAGEHGVPLIADGGIKRHGAILEALLFGGDTVMLGSMFAGTEETPGEVVQKSVVLPDAAASVKVPFKVLRGMASIQAIRDRLDVEDAETLDLEALGAEGTEVSVPARGSVRPIIQDILKHLCSSISYGGAQQPGGAQGGVLEGSVPLPDPACPRPGAANRTRDKDSGRLRLWARVRESHLHDVRVDAGIAIEAIAVRDVVEPVVHDERLVRLHEKADAAARVRGEVGVRRAIRHRLSRPDAAARELRVGRDATARLKIPAPQERRKAESVRGRRGNLAKHRHGLERPREPAAQRTGQMAVRQDAPPGDRLESEAMSTR